jgi:hypothetical protein
VKIHSVVIFHFEYDLDIYTAAFKGIVLLTLSLKGTGIFNDITVAYHFSALFVRNQQDFFHRLPVSNQFKGFPSN